MAVTSAVSSAIPTKDIWGQMAGDSFNFGELFGSQGFEGLLGGAGKATEIGGGIFSAFQNADLMKSQQALQDEQMGMTREAFDRNIAREDAMANLDFTSGR